MKIMVKLMAEIINDFFEPLSYKALGSMIVFGVGLIVMSGWIARDKGSKVI